MGENSGFDLESQNLMYFETEEEGYINSNINDP